jgi:hypothetical protein
MEEPRLPKGMIPPDIYRIIIGRIDGVHAVTALCHYTDLNEEEASDWFAFYKWAAANREARLEQAHKENQLKILLRLKRK